MWNLAPSSHQKPGWANRKFAEKSIENNFPRSRVPRKLAKANMSSLRERRIRPIRKYGVTSSINFRKFPTGKTNPFPQWRMNREVARTQKQLLQIWTILTKIRYQEHHLGSYQNNSRFQNYGDGCCAEKVLVWREKNLILSRGKCCVTKCQPFHGQIHAIL